MSDLLDLAQYERPAVNAAAHEAAETWGRELATWNPGSFSADHELLGELETIRDRTQDLIRNNGLASGAVQTHVDNVIGGGLLLNAKPDRRALGLKEGARADEMDEFETEIEAKFDAWSEDIGCYVDASRRSRFSGLLTQGYRSYLQSFEILATGEWLPGRGSKFSTAVQMIDPARLLNPVGMSDSATVRGGVRLGRMGDPLAYCIHSRVRNDPYCNWEEPLLTHKWVARELPPPISRQLVIHIFDNDRPGQTRGKNGIVATLARHKKLEKFENVSLEAAVYNAMYAAYIQSSLDWESVMQAMGASKESDPLRDYVTRQVAFHKAGNIRFNGVKIPHLLPGEELKHLAPQHPTPSFNAFEEAFLRQLAAGWNLTYEQLSRDYSKTNYSSARAAMLESWRFFNGKQYFIGGWFATQIYALWLEEAIDKGEIVLPAGLPDFYDEKQAWTTCEWIGPGRGHIDPLKEWNSKKVAYSMRQETMESIAAESGRRWKDLIDQHAQEERYAKKRGVDLSAVGGATPVPQPPDAPEGQDGHDSPAAPAASVPAPVPRRPNDSSGAVAAQPPAEPQQIHVHIAQPAVHVDARTSMAPGAVQVTVEPAQVHATVHADGLGEAIDGLAAETRAVKETLDKPVVPVHDADGKIIGAQRADSIEG